ncbi:MADF domain-containing protein [Nephila pilipes]|uniref:MADF domain-containing protein n=1 Tax=Nephila pilipes TaxID=299642 RepID=A0A8X6PYV1_NEPPI|nr:MADF domain-containing protein [Nephila pilipes]GFU31999.1 MADF domain-containing protein [Nephila pilipes]
MDQDAYKYLGVRVGFSFRQDHGELFRGISADVEKVSESLLAPWQQLTAIRAHVLARAECLCRNSHIRKRDVADLDKTLVRVGKKILNLPTRENNLVHLSCSKGGAALPEFRSLLDIHAVSHPFRLFASHDPNISGVAAESLRSVVRKKLLRDPTPGECCDFLNGKKDGDFARESGDISTQWSRARHSLQRLSCAIKFEWLFIEGTGYHLSVPQSSLRVPVQRRPGRLDSPGRNGEPLYLPAGGPRGSGGNHQGLLLPPCLQPFPSGGRLHPIL